MNALQSVRTFTNPLFERRGSYGDVASLRDPIKWMVDWWGGAESSAGVRVTADTATQVAAVYACVQVLAESLAQLPLLTYRSRADGGKDRAPDHPLYRLLHDQPNRWQTSFEFREMMMGHLMLRGNAYAERLYNGRGRVNELIPLHPDRVRPYWAKLYVPAYAYQPVDGPRRILLQDEMFHLRLRSKDGLIGISPIDEEREAVGLSIAMDRYGGKLFANGAAIRGVLTHPKTLKEQAQKTLRDSWEAVYAGVNNAGKTAILEEGMTWTQIGMTAEHAQFLGSRQYQVEEIARIFRVPPHKIGHLARCMPADTLVYTKQGPKPIAGVQVGEQVWSWNGTEWACSRVSNVFDNGVSKVLSIRTTNRTVRCTPTHRLLVRRCHERPLEPGEIGGRNTDGRKVRVEWRDEYVQAGELRVGDTLVTLGQLPEQARTIAPNGRRLTDGFMEFAGLLLGDGGINYDRGRPARVRIARGQAATYMPHYREVMRAEFVRYEGGNGRNNLAHAVALAPVTLLERERETVFASVLAATELVVLGFKGTAYTKRVPGWVFETTEALRLAFLRGFLDADGTVDKKGRISFASVNRPMLDQMRHLCMGLGIPVTNARFSDVVSGPPFMRNTVKCRCWSFTCSDPGSNRRISSHDTRYQKRFAEGVPFGRKDRKYPRFGGGQREYSTALARIASITEQPPEPVYDIEVERDHCFIADGVLSHNSTFNNIEHQAIEFVTDTMMPHVVRWEQAIRRDLILEREQDTVFIQFLLAGLLRGDAAARSAFYRERFNVGSMSQNDIRRHEDENPIPGGDRYFVPMNMVPTDKVDQFLERKPTGQSGDPPTTGPEGGQP